ncbi:hypothetical protein EJ08DRAFT_26408 [Tothia fuscella]|uniref:Cyanovirin-N domain-containing protein n=1 Tax=Tothia fuscella TaxID=1048955 RepID=A0A9P4NGU2_9PEZI|nr:hypothetical protein EJ08DRAFT_26408 [Tothia fuscella]
MMKSIRAVLFFSYILMTSTHACPSSSVIKPFIADITPTEPRIAQSDCTIVLTFFGQGNCRDQMRREWVCDGICYRDLNSNGLRMTRVCRDCRVSLFDNGDCSGSSVDLLGNDHCWEIHTRRSYQFYC